MVKRALTSRPERDLLAVDAIGIATAIVALMVVADERKPEDG